VAAVVTVVAACLVVRELGHVDRDDLDDGDQGDAIALGWRSTHLAVPASLSALPVVNGARPDLRRGTVVLNIWASTCGPCRQEMPWLERLQERPGTGLQVVGMTRDLFPAYARQALDRAGATYPNVIDRQAYAAEDLADVAPPSAVPSTLIIVDGTVRWSHVGVFSSSRELQQSVLDRVASPS
jgi:thiol-disulfide isomerase/thioredoxin